MQKSPMGLDLQGWLADLQIAQDAIFSLHLNAVERFVGFGHKGIQAVSLCQWCHAYGASDVLALMLKLALNPLGNLSCVVLSAARQEYDKLIAAPASCNIVVAQDIVQGFAHLSQYGIAKWMAKVIVDLLEVIKVEHH